MSSLKYLTLIKQLSTAPQLRTASRFYATNAIFKDKSRIDIPEKLLEAIKKKAVESQNALNELKQENEKKVGTVTVGTSLGGMRGAAVLLCETSNVDPNTGLSYRGIPIQQLITQLPKAEATKYQASDYPSTESLLWLLLTGALPTKEETELLRKALISAMKLPEHAIAAMQSLPASAHPMTQLITGVTACQTESVFSELYSSGQISKNEYWQYILKDGLSLIAKLPLIAGWIYRRITTKPEISSSCPPTDTSIDWSGNIAKMLGYENKDMEDVMRLYMFLHADHEGGNVSAHAGHLVASALADPFYSYSACMAGLAGPLHGLANQESLNWYLELQREFQRENKPINKENVSNYVKRHIFERKQVVPGFGHAVLRQTDPRFTLQKNFASKTMSNDPLFKLLEICLEVIPPLLESTGKVKNPWPNVDAHSGIILNHFGLTETNFYTVLFGVSRALGNVSQIVWDRILGLPIERPKSLTLEQLREIAKSSSK